MSSGGKRKGAGRPARKVPLVSLALRIEPALFAAWQKRKGKISGPKLLAALLKFKPKSNP